MDDDRKDRLGYLIVKTKERQSITPGFGLKSEKRLRKEGPPNNIITLNELITLNEFKEKYFKDELEDQNGERSSE